MFECASHSSSTKVPISTTSSTPSCSAFVWLSSRETLQPRQPQAGLAEASRSSAAAAPVADVFGATCTTRKASPP